MSMGIEFTSDIIVDLIDSMGSDVSIAQAARVSTQRDTLYYDMQTNAKLINYLMKNKHGSPFEHGTMTFRVTAPIFVFWDHVRHRIGVSYNIESSRYSELKPVFYVPSAARTQTGKPGHYIMSEGSEEQTSVMDQAIRTSCHYAYKKYRDMIDVGISREIAMSVLPMNTVISGYVTFNPRSLMKFLELRNEHARLEMQIVAEGYVTRFERLFPATAQAFQDNGRICP